jgi:ubiquinone/menaquinone biosynthesis C-methylase UbiE
MNDKRTEILSSLTIGDDGIYGYSFDNKGQEEEIKLRESVADHKYDNYLAEISKHHSVPVMDNEVARFLREIPSNGSIIDVGGCWGWHWRNIQKIRPDIKVYIVDFIRNNLIHAKNVLGNSVGKNIFLIHGDATNLVFDDEVFDGYWSVQTLQHIPNFETAIKEAFRILKNGGAFANYSLNTQWPIKLIYRLFGKGYHESGNIPGSFYLARASATQVEIIGSVFDDNVNKRYSEILFSPELKMTLAGRNNSILGVIDIHLSNNLGLLSGLARQQSYHVKKHNKANALGRQ